MFCSQCGANNADNAVVCNQCGRTLQAGGPPAYAQQAPMVPATGVYVQNYLVFAILATILCCLPAGIPAIVYAAQVNGKLAAGDIAGAQQSSKNAKLWCWISAGLGLGAIVIWIMLLLLGTLSHMNR
ncbi:MAG: CD225/dispanin family protein [Candidatus Sulfotelmatobacter sp.]